jgi:hypothetical protein
MLSCRFCSKDCKNDNSLRNHERLCSSNPNRQKTYFSSIENQRKMVSKRENQYQKAKRLGLPKPVLSEEGRAKIIATNKIVNANMSEESKQKRRDTIAEKVKNGEWHTSLAKRMHYRYKNIDMHGKWEYNYAVWLDKSNIQWEKCKESFEYFFEGKNRRYTPDFYLIESDTYVEVKGYKTGKDEAKWNQFPKHRKLKILMKEDLISLGVDINSSVAD